MNQRIVFLTGFPALWVLLWCLVAAVSVGTRPPLPGMELNTLSLAWDMWRQGEFLLPDLSFNGSGDIYPLYLWLIHVNWALFGVSDTWPRLLPPLLGLLNTVMIAALCRALWPGWAGLGALGGTMAMGMVCWLTLSSVAGAELLFSLCILVALFGMVRGWRYGTWDGFILLGIGVALGFLTKGIVVLVPILPVAILTPLWAPSLGWKDAGLKQGGEMTTGSSGQDSSQVSGWRNWYVRMCLSMLIAIVLLMGWIAPVVTGAMNDEGVAVGLSLALHLAIGSAGTLFSNPISGDQQWWLYLLTLGLFLFPWIVWPAAWRAVGGIWSLLKDGGGRFCLIWLLVPVIFYALSPGARPFNVALHVPPLAMIAAYLLYLRIDPEMARQETERRFANGEAVLGILIALIGLGLIVAPLSGGLMMLPWWIEGLSGAWGLVLLGVAAMAAYAAPRMVIFRATMVMVQMVLIVVIGMMAASPLLQAQVNINPPADHLRQVLEQELDVAFVGAGLPKSPALGFPARLEQPLTYLDPEDSIGIVAWAAGHEDGQIAVVMEQLLMGGEPDAIFPYMGQYLVFWPARIIAKQPSIVIDPNFSKDASG